MKKGLIPKIQPKPIPKSSKRYEAYYNLTNEEALRRTLRLLGVTNEEYMKQTKASLSAQLFPRSLPSAANSKQFFYISMFCVKILGARQEAETLVMWYPPKSVNEQIEFKKTLFKLVQRWQAQGNLPKNTVLSKGVLMGDSPAASVLEFLRVISQFSLRAVYLQRYSKNERLIQVAVNPITQGPENDLNRFYLFPFVESLTASEPPLKASQLEALKQIYRVYLDRYRKKILSLRTVGGEDELINGQTIMAKLVEQKQLAQTLNTKVGKTIFSQNRAFDRRIILDKNSQIWKQIGEIQCNFIERSDSLILRAEGETSKILGNWRPVSGSTVIRDFISKSDKIIDLKLKCKQILSQFTELKINFAKTFDLVE